MMSRRRLRKANRHRRKATRRRGSTETSGLPRRAPTSCAAPGTTFVVAIAVDKPDNIVERASFPTTTPAETLGKCRAWLEARSFDALGVATFGPVDPTVGSPTYGRITETPKPGARPAFPRDAPRAAFAFSRDAPRGRSRVLT